MQGKKLYEYAVIRVVPRVEREEFINVGIVLFCKKTKYLQCKVNLQPKRIACLFAEVDMELVAQNLNAYVAIAQGSKDAGPIAQLDAPERFRWLTATRSTIIQSSKVHPGLGDEECEVLERLFAALVG